MRLFLLHQGPGRGPLPVGAPTWRTCLRELAFLDDPCCPSSGQHLVSDEHAYALLLEIVCGLRSPLVGETEVQAQFKAFLASVDPDRHLDVRRVGQRVLTDAKRIRQDHLQGFGAHSYGALAARLVPADRHVAIIGAGALATAVIDALRAPSAIDQWARRVIDGRPDVLQVDAAARHGVITDAPVTLVLASPVRSEIAARVAACYPQLREILDLRSADERSEVAAGVPVLTLDDLFDNVAGSASVPLARVAAARRDIARLARAFASREQLRPLGWDDLCA